MRARGETFVVLHIVKQGRRKERMRLASLCLLWWYAASCEAVGVKGASAILKYARFFPRFHVDSLWRTCRKCLSLRETAAERRERERGWCVLGVFILLCRRTSCSLQFPRALEIHLVGFKGNVLRLWPHVAHDLCRCSPFSKADPKLLSWLPFLPSSQPFVSCYIILIWNWLLYST